MSRRRLVQTSVRLVSMRADFLRPAEIEERLADARVSTSSSLQVFDGGAWGITNVHGPQRSTKVASDVHVVIAVSAASIASARRR